MANATSDTMSGTARWTDRAVEKTMAALLRSGVMLAAVVVLTGAVVYLFRNGYSAADYRIFRGEPNDLRHVRGIFRDVAHWRGRGIIQLGLLLLIATPVARVAFSVVAFAVERDRMYALFTLWVLAILLYSLLAV